MKTDRFDEEFRRKLRGLPHESSPDEVNRIVDHVSRNLPPTPGIGWGGLAGYVAGGLVLLGSLLYNVMQYQKTTALQTSVDSLKTAPPALAQQTIPVAPPFVRTDTVYVTRYRNSTDAARIVLNQPIVTSTEQATQISSEVARNRLKSPVLTNPNQSAGPTNESASASSESGHTKDRRLPQSLLKIKPETGPKPAQKEAIVTTEPAIGSTGAPAVESLVKNAESIPLASVWPETSAEPNLANPLRNTVSASKNALNRRDLARAKNRQKTKANSYVNEVSARDRMARATINQTVADNTAPNPTGSGLTEPVQPGTELEKELTKRAKVVVSSLKNRSLSSTNLSSTILRKPVSLSKVLAVRKSFRMHLPSVSLPKAQYFGGAGFSLGSGQVGGSLLGEVRLNPRWSVQTGVQMMAQKGFRYHSSEAFEEHEGRDFHALYAPNVAPGNEIQNIDQTYTLFQIPLTVAYHYPLGRVWALRLGVGTNLDLLAHSRITFDYERNGREFEHGLDEGSTRVSLFNNATVSLGLERQWKRLLFRASPYISPQLKQVSYKDDAVYWGGQVQVLWQFR